jgi:hypothetical protein
MINEFKFGGIIWSIIIYLLQHRVEPDPWYHPWCCS